MNKLKRKLINMIFNSIDEDEYALFSLPSDYQQVEYLESTVTQRIDTGYTPSNKTKIVMVCVDETSLTDNPFALVVSNNAWTFGFNKTSAYGNGYCGWWNGERYYNDDELPEGWQKLQLSSEGFYLNDEFVHGASSVVFQHTCDLTLFCYHRTNEYRYGTVKIKSCKIYDDGESERDFVPCYRKSDNVAGMYDTVNDVFYTNAGSGTFIVGDDVN